MKLDFIGYHASVRPDRRACVDLRTGETVTWRELDALVARTAGLLHARLRQPLGERVATLALNGLDTILLHYACERTGAIFVPLNWRLAVPELAGLLAGAQPALLVHDVDFTELATGAMHGLPAIPLISMADFRPAVQASAPAPVAPAPPGAPWTLLYTSGTTGKPKGAIITREGSMWGSLNLSQILQIGPDSVMLCDPPMFHTVGLFGISRTALMVGATLVISDRFNAPATLARFGDKDLGVTHYFGVPQIGQMLMDDPGFASADLSGLKVVAMGGAPLPSVVAHAFADRGVPLCNGFGMTETCSVMHMPLDLDRIRAKPSHVGYPAPGIELRIVDPEGRDVPEGQIGELWLKGPSISPGYWNQPDATAATFSGEWFRSGDAARCDPADGAFEIVDRWKDMYISGGENVYPIEVETAIQTLAGVSQVAVVGVPSARWGECGCAYIVADPDAGLTPQAVIAHCGALLAGYKRPTHVRFVDALPRTASGKVRKTELRTGFSE